MKLTFDLKKDAANVAKHGVSLEVAEDLEWDTLKCKPDTRREYGEPRQIGYVMEDERLHCVVFVDRPSDAPTERRIISLRKANQREVKSYVANAIKAQG
jgi:uncharacterized DUF497 family protein